MPRLRHGPRINLARQEIFAEGSVRCSEKQISRRKLLGGWSLGLLERADRLCECADWIVVEPHSIEVRRQNRVGERLRTVLVQSFAGEPERIASVKLVEPLGMSPL